MVTFIKDIFDKTVSYYAKYRLEPPKEVINELKKIGELNGHERLLDIGCGPGTSSFLFSPYFKEIIAVDRNLQMIQEGIKKANFLRISNISWLCSSGEAINMQIIGDVDFVIFASSFHWMNQSLILKRIANRVKKGGAIMGNKSSWNKHQKFDEIIVSTVKEFVGETRQTLQGNYKEPKKNVKEIIDDSPFTFLETKTIKFTHEFSVDELIGLQLSTSYANENLFGSRTNDFIATLRNRLQMISNNGKIISEELYDVLLFIK